MQAHIAQNAVVNSTLETRNKCVGATTCQIAELLLDYWPVDIGVR